MRFLGFISLPLQMGWKVSFRLSLERSLWSEEPSTR